MLWSLGLPIERGKQEEQQHAPMSTFMTFYNKFTIQSYGNFQKRIILRAVL